MQGVNNLSRGRYQKLTSGGGRGVARLPLVNSGNDPGANASQIWLMLWFRYQDWSILILMDLSLASN
jgi:hypothetical protein